MNIFIRVIQILAITALGFYSYLGLVLYLFSPTLFGNAAREQHDALTLQLGVFGGGMWACIIGIIISMGSLFFDGPNRKWFLFAPLYIPLLYLIGAITYFGT